MKTRAVVVRGPGAPVAVEEIEIDPPGPGEVLVRVVATGVCHSDLHVVDGLGRFSLDRPFVLGHEGAGVVEAVGPGASLRVGQPVALSWLVPCGRCRSCR